MGPKEYTIEDIEGIQKSLEEDHNITFLINDWVMLPEGDNRSFLRVGEIVGIEVGYTDNSGSKIMLRSGHSLFTKTKRAVIYNLVQLHNLKYSS